MDYRDLKADVELYISKHYTPGRRGCRIEFVGIHHTAAVGLTVRGCYNVCPTGPASAHYLVQTDGVIGQLVHDADTAWALGDFDANCRLVNIEHANNGSDPWTVSETCLDSDAHLVAALCLAYGLGHPAWGRNVRPHSMYMATACPGELARSQRDVYIARARRYYDMMTAGAADEEEIVTDQDIQKIAELAAQKVWACTSGHETCDRVRRSTQILKIMCGMGADSMVEPKAYEQDLHDWTIGRWQRCTAMLKSLMGIPVDDMQSTEPTDASPLALSDDDIERIAERVAELVADR